MYIFPRKDSAFLYVRYWDARRGKWRNRSTKVRASDPAKDRKLAKLLHKLEGENLDAPSAESGERETALARWVPGWLRSTYRKDSGTLAIYEQRWRALLSFLHARKLYHAADITREHAAAYIEWRTHMRKGNNGLTIKRNTCIAELKMLAMVLFEAIRRGQITDNPMSKLRLRKEATAIKPEFTDEEIAVVRQELRQADEWMRVAFEIAIYTALRHAETRMELRNVNFARGEIFVPEPKGGKRKAYTIPLPDELRPMLQRLKDAGAKVTWAKPTEKGTKPLALQWRDLLDRCGLREHTFHSTRVTFITRGCRAGIPEGMMRRLVNHASAEIHAIYQRVGIEDLRAWRPKITLPPAPE